MDFGFTPRTLEWQSRLMGFVNEHIVPAEPRFRAEMEENRRQGRQWNGTHVVMDELKEKARAAGLWNMFLPESRKGAGLTNVEYAPLCEIMGRYPLTSEAMNCSAPDTGNMELLERYGTEAHKERWLRPLLAGEIRSGFAMTEPDVPSSDATQIQSRIGRDGDHYVINGRKWWTSGAPDPRTGRCRSTAAPACRRTPRSPLPGPARARSALPTGPTRCTAMRSARPNFPGT